MALVNLINSENMIQSGPTFAVNLAGSANLQPKTLCQDFIYIAAAAPIQKTATFSLFILRLCDVQTPSVHTHRRWEPEDSIDTPGAGSMSPILCCISIARVTKSISRKGQEDTKLNSLLDDHSATTPHQLSKSHDAAATRCATS